MIQSLFSSQSYVASKQMLDATVVRQQGLAANIANVETPGYKRLDLPRDFAKEFGAKLQAGEASSMAPAKLAADTATPSIRKDGNNVSLDREMLAMSKNSVEFDTMTELVSGSIKALRLAISGRNG